jgi:hypothetical protein
MGSIDSHRHRPEAHGMKVIGGNWLRVFREVRARETHDRR